MKIMRLFRSDGAYGNAFCSILTAGLLSACGSEGLIAIAIVTPLGGLWENVPLKESLQLTGSPPDTVMFASKLNVTGSVTTESNVCGGGFAPGGSVNLEGTLDNGNLVLHPVGVTTTCLEGRFTDLVTLDVLPTGQPRRLYENGRVDVRMDLGLWVSDGSGQLKLKFVEPVSVNNNTNTTNNDAADVIGCDVSGSVIKFLGKMNGFDTNSKAKPLIPEIRSDPGNVQLFTQVVFVDGATLTLLNSAGQAVTLHRTPDTTTTCP